MEIVLERLPVEGSPLAIDGVFPRLKGGLCFAKCGLDLIFATIFLIGAGDLLPFGEITLAVGGELGGDVHIVLRDLRAEIAAARVHDEIFLPFLVHVQFNKVIAPAEGAERALGRRNALDIFVTQESGEVEGFPRLAPGGVSAREDMRRAVKLLEVDIHLAERDGVHPAPDIQAHERGRDPLPDGHRRADRAPLPRVNVGHDTDLAPRIDGIARHSPDLFARLVLDIFCKTEGCIMFSFDRDHIVSPLSFLT